MPNDDDDNKRFRAKKGRQVRKLGTQVCVLNLYFKAKKEKKAQQAIKARAAIPAMVNSRLLQPKILIDMQNFQMAVGATMVSCAAECFSSTICSIYTGIPGGIGARGVKVKWQLEVEQLAGNRTT